MSDEREKSIGEAEAHEGDDVEAHKVHEKVYEKVHEAPAATEEGPDVEGHGFHPKTTPAKTTPA